jgi:subtilisin family serine protease
MSAFYRVKVLCQNLPKHYIPIAVVLSLLSAMCYAEHVPDELIIKMKPGKSAAFTAMSAPTKATIKREFKNSRYVSLKLPKGADLERVMADYRENPNVEYVGYNHILRVCAPQQVWPDDPVFYDGDEFWGIPQWGLYNDVGTPRADIHAPEAWHITTGSTNIIIAIVDTGILFDHPDLENKIWTNSREIPNNGIDDDSNGFIDDVHGWNFVDGTNDPTDDYEIYHGSLVSGIAAAESNNGIGIAGIAWQSPIMPLKVLDSSGMGSEDDAAAAVNYAVRMGAKVINMSLSGEDAPLLHQAVNDAWAAGCLCVCASGNENSGQPSYPASYERSLAVGATNEYDERCTAQDWGSGGSNYGSYLDVCAPGSYIVSTGNFLYDWGLTYEPYDTQSGTSAAAPFVSGVAALVWAKNPTWTNQQVFYHICHTADDVNTTGYDIYTGWGRVNAYRAVSEEIVTVQKPASIKLMTTDAEISLTSKVLSTASTDIANRLYIQDPDRTSGICLYFSNGSVPTGFSRGDVVNILGITGNIAGEVSIIDPIITRITSGDAPKPLGMSNRVTGGGWFGRQGPVVNRYSIPQTMGVGPNNIGLLVKAFGKVTAVASDYFYIDDGSKLRDDTGNIGIRVSFNPDKMQRPDKDQIVWVVGISSCEFVPNSSTIRRRVLRPRTQDDIKILKQ